MLEKYINEHGTEPSSGEALSPEDLVIVRSSHIVRPRPPTLTSIPALLATFQNEWDNLALETYNLREELTRTREELATALYQHDAAVRVIARLSKERDEARESLSKVTISDGAANGDEMAVDNVEVLPETLAEHVDQIHQKYVEVSQEPLSKFRMLTSSSSLSKGRKKRPVPEDWVTSDEISSFVVLASNSLPVPQATSIDVEGSYAALGGWTGEAAVYSLDADKLERQLPVDEPITDTLWRGTRLYFATGQGNVKIYESGNEAATLSEHAGPVTSVSMHPGGEILGSVGADKSVVLYEVSTLKRVSRVFADACKFHAQFRSLTQRGILD